MVSAFLSKDNDYLKSPLKTILGPPFLLLCPLLRSPEDLLGLYLATRAPHRNVREAAKLNCL